MSFAPEIETLFATLRQSGRPEAALAIETHVKNARDRDLCRINPLAFAASHDFDSEDVIAAFLHAAHLGILELAWNVFCPSCSGVLESTATLKSIKRAEYMCAFCDASYEPKLDEVVEVTFTISPRVRRIAAHEPHTLPVWEYYRQVFWSSGIELPDDASFGKVIDDAVLDAVELPAGGKAILSLQLPETPLILCDPVVHNSQFLNVKGEATRERQNLSFVLTKEQGVASAVELRPGLSASRSRTGPISARFRPYGLPGRHCTRFWAHVGPISRPSIFLPIRRSATSTARIPWTSTSGSRSPASPSSSPT